MAAGLTHASNLDDQPLKAGVAPKPARLRLGFPLGTVAAFILLAILDIDVGWLLGHLVGTLPFDRRPSDEWLLLIIRTSRLFCWAIAGVLAYWRSRWWRA